MAKAQLFTWDLVLGTSLFILALAGVFYLWNSTTFRIEDAELKYDMGWVSTRAGEQLVRTPGKPEEWNEYNVGVFGLAETKDLVGSDLVQDRILDPDKFLMFANSTNREYPLVRNMLLGTSRYNFYIEFFCKEPNCFDDLDLDDNMSGTIDCDYGGHFEMGGLNASFTPMTSSPFANDTCIIGKYVTSATYMVPHVKNAVFSEKIDITDPNESPEKELNHRFGMRFVVYMGDASAYGITTSTSTTITTSTSTTTTSTTTTTTIASGYASVWKVDTDGNLLWTYDTGDYTRVVDAGNSIVVVGGKWVEGSSVWALEPDDGSKIWNESAVSSNERSTDSVHIYQNSIVYAGSLQAAPDDYGDANIWKFDIDGNVLDSTHIRGRADSTITTVSSITTNPFGDIFLGLNTGLGIPEIDVGRYRQSDWGVVWESSWFSRSDSVATVKYAPNGMIYGVGIQQSGFAPPYDDARVQRYTPDGALTYIHTGTVNAMLDIALDSDDNMYLARYRTGDGSVHKTNSTGGTDSSWGVNGWYDTEANTRGIAIDSVGNVYVVGTRSGQGSIWKLNSSGNLIWSCDTGDSTGDIYVDSHGSIYVTGTRARISSYSCRNAPTYASVWKLSNDGNLLWRYDTGSSTWAVDTDTGIAVVVGNSVGGSNVWALEPDGALDWNYETGGNVARSVRIYSGRVYVGGLQNTVTDKNLWELDINNGNELGTQLIEGGADPTGVYGIDIDAYGDIYFYTHATDWGDTDVSKYDRGTWTRTWAHAWPDNVADREGAIKVGGDSRIYAIGYEWGSSRSNIHRYNRDGTAYTELNDQGIYYYDITLDSNSDIYIATDYDGGSVWKWRNSGGYDYGWGDNAKYITGGTARGLVTDSDGNLYIAGMRSGQGSIWKLNSTGQVVWRCDTGDNTLGIDLDDEGNIYVAGYRTSASGIECTNVVPTTTTTVTTTSSTSTSTTSTIPPMECELSDPRYLLNNDVMSLGAPVYNPSGTEIVYDLWGADWIKYDYDIWVMDANGGNHVQLTVEDENQQSPAFSPDGTTIVYSSHEDGGGYYDIWTMDTSGGSRVQLTDDGDHQYTPEFSPSGAEIVYSSREDGGSYYDIWIMDAIGGPRAQLTDEASHEYNPSFSPDGTKIVYESGGEIWTMDSNGNNKAQITSIGGNPQNPMFSPDGSKIVYSSYEGGSPYYYIWIMDANGGNHVQLTEGEDSKSPSFSPSGTKIVYAYEPGADYEIWYIDCIPW